MTKGWKNLTFYAKTHIFLCSDECFSRQEKYRDGVSALLNFIYLCILFKTKMRY